MKWLVSVSIINLPLLGFAAPLEGSLGDTLNVTISNSGEVQRSAALSGPSGNGILVSGYSLGIDSQEALVLQNQALDPASIAGTLVESYTGSEVAGGATVRVVNTGIGGGSVSGALVDELTTLVASGLQSHSGGYIPESVSTPIIRGALNGDNVEGLIEDTVLALVLEEAERLVVGQLGARIQTASGGTVTPEQVRNVFRRATQRVRTNP